MRLISWFLDHFWTRYCVVHRHVERGSGEIFCPYTTPPVRGCLKARAILRAWIRRDPLRNRGEMFKF
jgi:hypothetical protein